MNRRGTVATVSALALAAAGLTPALASPTSVKHKNFKGTWTFTDFTVDPTPSAMGVAPKTPARDGYCVGTLPDGPADETTQKVKIAGRGTLTVLGANTGDWAMEVRDAKGTFLAGSDGDMPQDKEGVPVALRKPGTYSVTFCNLGGAPTTDATYSFKYRR
jgi:hypothetical protein